MNDELNGCTCDCCADADEPAAPDQHKVMVTDITLPVEDAAEILRRRIADGARKLRGREDLQTPTETRDTLFWILDATMQYMDLFDLEIPTDEPDAPGGEEGSNGDV